MTKTQVYLVVAGIFVLTFLAANFIYPQFLNFGFIPKVPFRLGLDLQGGIHLVYGADLSAITEKDRKSAMDGLRDVIERRVNIFGVKEPVVQVQRDKLIVELAGIIDPAQAIRLIGETPFLEFRELTKEAGEGEKEALEFIPTPLTGRYLEKAEVVFDQLTSRPAISLQFNQEGAKTFEELTARNVGKPLAVYIDGVLISAPVVQETISGGRAQITGEFTIGEAQELARNLSAGALPLPVVLISQQSVGPTLGAQSLKQSLKAGVIGFLAVIIFIIIFYRLPGALAGLALVIYIILALSVFKIIPVTLTLAGIGGLILSIGMAIDANILIFSRMREELKEGKNFGIALKQGFSRAWPSIRDGNLTTLLVALILFGFGTSFVKGFALALIVGILISMFSAVVITKSFLMAFEGTKLANIKCLWS